MNCLRNKSEFAKILNEATIVTDDRSDNVDSLQELKLNHKNTRYKVEASKDKIKRFIESVAAVENKIKDIDHQIEDTKNKFNYLRSK